MIQVKNDHFSIDQIAESGQCFRLKEEGGIYSLIAFGRYLEIEQKDGEIYLHCSSKEFSEVWEEYFDLKTDYRRFTDRRADGEALDLYLQRAVEFGKGIRILKQDLWEIIISFLISQQNNIKRIRRCIETLCERYGEKKGIESLDGIKVYSTFPSAQALADVSEEELRACGLGYRSRYITNTVKSVLDGTISLASIRESSYLDARKELLKLCGVGEKVADCICLFGLHHLEAFPVDTHIRHVLEEHYEGTFPFEFYAGYEGVIQQYLFYYDFKQKDDEYKTA